MKNYFDIGSQITLIKIQEAEFLEEKLGWAIADSATESESSSIALDYPHQATQLTKENQARKNWQTAIALSYPSWGMSSIRAENRVKRYYMSNTSLFRS